MIGVTILLWIFPVSVGISSNSFLKSAGKDSHVSGVPSGLTLFKFAKDREVLGFCVD